VYSLNNSEWISRYEGFQFPKYRIWFICSLNFTSVENSIPMVWFKFIPVMNNNRLIRLFLIFIIIFILKWQKYQAQQSEFLQDLYFQFSRIFQIKKSYNMEILRILFFIRIRQFILQLLLIIIPASKVFSFIFLNFWNDRTY
jgi:hypothetical protein